jgi:ketosteroid isomerase-like protein
VTDDELNILVAHTEKIANAWMQGDWDGGYGAALTAREDATIYGPFGGPATVGARAWAEGAKVGIKQFRNGQSNVNLVQSYASGDLLVLVLLEEQSGEVGGIPNQPWSLRVTLVYRREEEGWRVVHRHADPLVKRRTLQEVASMAKSRVG